MSYCSADPFQNDFPEVIEEYLEHGNAKCIAFNRRGTLLASKISFFRPENDHNRTFDLSFILGIVENCNTKYFLAL